MARNLTVKVATAKVIKALEDKLESNKEAVAFNKAQDESYPAILKAHQESLLANFADALEVKDISFRSWNRNLVVDYQVKEGVEVPETPRKESKPMLHYTQVEEIQNAIRILQMTDEEVVNASTFKSIAGYL